jgi:coenzyme F420-0:L-glutamate ligase/coenzyme F420-1:gamma-L-glutamate ligase
VPAPHQLQLWAIPGLPFIGAGDDIAGTIVERLQASGREFLDQDVVVIAQKIVSKSEGRLVDLATVIPSQRAMDIAHEVLKDPRLVEVILGESRRIVRSGRNVLIVEHRLGFIMANAGVDQSNVASEVSGEFALLLPIDPDASAERIRADIGRRTGKDVAVVISDSFGRPWRTGTVGIAIGCAGLPALLDLRGDPDLYGRTLQVTVVGHADEIAAAASLLMGQSDEGQPVVVMRGLVCDRKPEPAAALIRPAEEDLFR